MLRRKLEPMHSMSPPCADGDGTITACFASDFSPDDSLLATGHFDGVVRLWDTTTGSLSIKINEPAPVTQFRTLKEDMVVELPS